MGQSLNIGSPWTCLGKASWTSCTALSKDACKSSGEWKFMASWTTRWTERIRASWLMRFALTSSFSAFSRAGGWLTIVESAVWALLSRVFCLQNWSLPSSADCLLWWTVISSGGQEKVEAMQFPIWGPLWCSVASFWEASRHLPWKKKVDKHSICFFLVEFHRVFRSFTYQVKEKKQRWECLWRFYSDAWRSYPRACPMNGQFQSDLRIAELADTFHFPWTIHRLMR